MGVSIGGLSFFNPSSSVSVVYTTEGDGNKIGRKDTVSVTDIITSADTSNVSSGYTSALALSMSGEEVPISHAGGSGMGYVKSVSLDGDSDFVHKVGYTITAEFRPDIVIPGMYADIIGTKKVISLSCSLETEVPYDITNVSVPGGGGAPGGSYQNKGTIKRVSAQATCAGQNKESDAKTIVDNLIASSGFSIAGGDLVTSVNSSTIGNGGFSVNITTTNMPGGISATAELSTSKNGVDNTEDISFKMTFTGVEGLSYDGDYKVTGYSSGLSAGAASVAQSVFDYFKAQKTVSSTELQGAGVVQKCGTLPKIITSGCLRIKTLGLEENKGGNSSTVIVEATTKASSDCDNNGLRTNYSIAKYDQRPVYVEANSWLGPEYIVQNFQTKRSRYNEYTVDINSIRSCISSPDVKDKAKSIFESIKEGGGTITNYVISISKNSCSLTATEYFS